MDLWSKSPPAHWHPKGLLCLFKDLAAGGPGSPLHPPHPQCAEGDSTDAPQGFAAPRGGWVPRQDTMPAAHLPWKGTLRVTSPRKTLGKSCLLLCRVSGGEIWGPGCLSPILRGEGWRPHPPSHPSVMQGKASQSQAGTEGSDKGRVWGGCSRPTPAFVFFPAVTSQKCFSQLHPAAVRATRPGE